ncbi:hypothetical protein Dimus_026885 [Dionaea muscipula]
MVAETSSVLPIQEEHRSSQLLSEIVSEVDKGKAPVEVDPACLTGVSASTAQTSTSTPSPPQGVKVSRSILDALNQIVDDRIAASYVWVDEGLYPRDNEILLGKDPRRLRGATMVNLTESETIKELRATNQKLKERLDDGKKNRKTLVGVLNEYEERAKVNAIKEFVHSSIFEGGLARVIGPWFMNDFSFCTAQVKDLRQRAGKNLSILKGLNMGRQIAFPTEPYVKYPEEFLPSHSSNARLPNPFKFLKDWIEEEGKKDQLESRRRSSRKK